MIETCELGKKFNDFWAVEGMTLNVKPGQILALLGQNGAGKTTTVRMLTALLRPTTGWARVAGYDAARQGGAVRASVGVLTEQQGLYVRMNAREYLDFFAEAYSMPAGQRKSRSDYLLDYFGLQEAAGRRIGEYSKGMKQKLALARALMHEPPVLLLDEPTSAMDPESARLVRDEIANLRSSQRAIVICTHNLAEAEALADIVVIIYRGRILLQGSLEALKDRVLGPVEFNARFSREWQPDGLELPDGVTLKKVEPEGTRFAVEQPQTGNPLLLKALAAVNAPLLTFQEVPRSLEQVYLKVMTEVQGGSHAV